MPNLPIRQATEAYLEYGVLGITIVVLLIVTALLVWHILKDKTQDQIIGNAIKKMADNQENFVLMYSESQKQHKEIVTVLRETLEIERSNTKACYSQVMSKIDKILHNQDIEFQLRKAS